ncbi:MAG: heme A synthase [Gammaproteobacteria bacterium]|nr:MAG: heme A synthase [Gammaproteobacteria bacterium]
MQRLFQRLGYFTTLFALVVIVLGAFVRLSDAGLGCPDWPGCYGQIVVPSSESAVLEAQNSYPERALESEKAWKEMAHRYFAATLGFLILALAVIAWLNRKDSEQQILLPLFLVGLVIFQAALGMWTVTLLLKPVIVTLHLLAGMATLGLLWLMTLRASRKKSIFADRPPSNLKGWAFLALIILIGQIALGGWTSTNYVALHCPDFPTCQGSWLPELDMDEAFTIWRESGVDYEGGVLSLNAGVAVHFMHRLGAVTTLLVVGLLALRCMLGRYSGVRLLGATVFLLLMIQVSLGIANVMLRLPMPIAVSHNGVAALLLMSLLALNFRLSRAS